MRWICFLFIISPQYIYSANEKSSCFEWRFQQVVRIKIPSSLCSHAACRLVSVGSALVLFAIVITGVDEN